MITDSILGIFFKLLDKLDFKFFEIDSDFVNGFLNILSYLSWINYIINVPLMLGTLVTVILVKSNAAVIKILCRLIKLQ